MGNSMSDMFYPDNPNRRKRAIELNDDLSFLKNQYDNLKVQFTNTIGGMQSDIDYILRQLGYSTIEQLQAVIMEKLDSDTARKWKAQIDEFRQIDSIGSTLSDILTITSLSVTVIVEVAVFLGAITAATGGVALAVFAGIAAALAVIGLIYSAIEGAIQRDKYRSIINDEFKARVTAKRSVEQLQILLNWGVALGSLMAVYKAKGLTGEEAAKQVVTQMADLVSQVTNLLNIWTMAHAYDEMHDMDVKRGSWTNEDPSEADAIAVATTARMLEATATLNVPSTKELVNKDTPTLNNIELASPTDTLKGLTAYLEKQNGPTAGEVFIKTADGKFLNTENGQLNMTSEDNKGLFTIQLQKIENNTAQVSVSSGAYLQIWTATLLK